MARGQCAGADLDAHECRLTVMGLYAAKNAVLVAAQLELGNVAARLFLHMALECWDEQRGDQQPRRYFAGREASAIALGFLAPRNGSGAAHQVVNRAVRELITKGAIRRIRPGGNGMPAEYELLVDSSRPFSVRRGAADPIPFPTPPQGVTDWHPQGVSF